MPSTSVLGMSLQAKDANGIMKQDIEAIAQIFREEGLIVHYPARNGTMPCQLTMEIDLQPTQRYFIPQRYLITVWDDDSISVAKIKPSMSGIITFSLSDPQVFKQISTHIKSAH